MNKILKYSLIIIMILSILSNFFLLYVIVINEVSWEDDYYINNIEWCEFVNDDFNMINDLIIELQYYNDEYKELELLEKIDCWETYSVFSESDKQ